MAHFRALLVSVSKVEQEVGDVNTNISVGADTKIPVFPSVCR